MDHKDAPTILQETTEPGVIDQNLLVALIIDQGPKGEAARLFLQDGIRLNETNEICIEFLHILNIDHLWVMPNLVKLKLSNNIIEKIENLDALVNLKELDLSFNYIKTIENLHHLKKLEVLLLYSNEISIVEGLDQLTELTILSIGNNKIEDWDHVMYLRNFEKLRSLNMEKNPCAEKEGYRNHVIAFLPQLIYYRYEMIQEEERNTAMEIYYREISNLEEIEMKEKKKRDKQKAFEEKTALLSLSYVEYLDEDHLFRHMFEDDKEGNDLSLITDDTQNAFEEYRKAFSAICNEFLDIGVKEQERRMDEINAFKAAVSKGKDAVEAKARTLVNNLLDKKMEIFAEIKLLTKTIGEDIELEAFDERMEKAQQLADEFSETITKTWAKLMAEEVTLHDQIEDINEVFKVNMKDLVDTFLEIAQEYFSRMRNAEAEYNDNINNAALFYISGFGDEVKMPDHIVELCGDKDVLSNNLAASHDTHLQVIDAREDRMLSRIKDWLQEYTDQLMKDETKRNRQKILEISHFLESQRNEFNSLQLFKYLPINMGAANSTTK